MLTYHQRGILPFTWGQSHKICSWNLDVKITNLRLQPHLPGANELIAPMGCIMIGWILLFRVTRTCLKLSVDSTLYGPSVAIELFWNTQTNLGLWDSFDPTAYWLPLCSIRLRNAIFYSTIFTGSIWSDPLIDFYVVLWFEKKILCSIIERNVCVFPLVVTSFKWELSLHCAM